MGNAAEKQADGRMTRKEIENSLARAFYTLDLAAQAINRLETFTFGLTKLLKDKEVLALSELDKAMQVLVHQEDLEKFWDCDVETFEPPPTEAEEEAEFDMEFGDDSVSPEETVVSSDPTE